MAILGKDNSWHSLFLKLSELYLFIKDHSFSKGILKMHSHIPQDREEFMVPQFRQPFSLL